MGINRIFSLDIHNNHINGNIMVGNYSHFCQTPTQLNSTQLKATMKQLAMELDIVVKWPTAPPTPPPLPQTFHPLLDQLESWNLAQTHTRPTALR